MTGIIKNFCVRKHLRISHPAQGRIQEFPGGGNLGFKYFLNTNNTGAFPSASVLMDISIYVSLIRLTFGHPYKK